jgi:MFS family permease
MSAVFTCFWTTLTFLLASPPFEYTPLTIGLFSLLGVVAIITIPIYGRVIDHFVPLFTIIMGQIIVIIGCALGTSLGTFSVVGPVIQGIAMDFGMQTAQIANRSSIFGINPKARNRINTAYMASSFAGQLTGTAVGNRLYAEGGWHWSGAFSCK